MLGGNNNATTLPIFLDENHLQYHVNASNQLQLFGNFGCNVDQQHIEPLSHYAGSAGCSVDPVNYFGNEHTAHMLHPKKRSREADTIPRQQKLQIFLNYNACHDEADRSANIPNQNPVSTGLRLSYDDDEHNSSVTSPSGSMTAAPPTILSLGDNMRTDLDRQNEELNQYIKIQEENLAKGIRDIKQRHMASFLTVIEKGVSRKLQEKDLEIENINQKNRELVERIKQVAVEAQNWHHRAKYNESMVSILKNNLQQAISQGAERSKEGFGDSEIDDAASYVDPRNYLSIPGRSQHPRTSDNSTIHQPKFSRKTQAHPESKEERMSVASSPIPFIKIPKSSSPSSSSSFSCSSPSPSSSSCSSSSPSSFRFSLSKPSVLTIRSSQTEGPLRRPLAPSPPPAVKPLQPPSPTPPAPKPSPPSVAAPVKEKGAAVVTLEFQRQMAKELQDYFKQKKLEEANKGPVFGFVGKNEISNGRWAMFGFAVGLLTEYATGYDLVDQVKILLSNFGIVDLE